MTVSGTDLAKIEAKLDVLVRLTAHLCVEGKKSDEAIVTLDRLGLDRNLIQAVCNAAPSTIRARVSEAKKKGKRPSTRQRGPND